MDEVIIMKVVDRLRKIAERRKKEAFEQAKETIMRIADERKQINK